MGGLWMWSGALCVLGGLFWLMKSPKTEGGFLKRGLKILLVLVSAGASLGAAAAVWSLGRELFFMLVPALAVWAGLAVALVSGQNLWDRK